jgi:hypothetical protein
MSVAGRTRRGPTVTSYHVQLSDGQEFTVIAHAAQLRRNLSCSGRPSASSTKSRPVRSRCPCAFLSAGDDATPGRGVRRRLGVPSARWLGARVRSAERTDLLSRRRSAAYASRYEIGSVAGAVTSKKCFGA